MVAFSVLSLIIILSGVGVVGFRNPINSALCLVVNLLGVAGIFAMLDAHFLAVVQVIVYAGAIVVLVLFVLMLLNIKTERASFKEKMLAGIATLSGLLFLGVLVPFLNEGFLVFPEKSLPSGIEPVQGTVREIGKVLYTQYTFPFEIASVLIMAAIVGAVMLAKRRRPAGTLAPRESTLQ